VDGPLLQTNFAWYWIAVLSETTTTAAQQYRDSPTEDEREHDNRDPEAHQRQGSWCRPAATAAVVVKHTDMAVASGSWKKRGSHDE
jgi:hypothetical protein